MTIEGFFIIFLVIFLDHCHLKDLIFEYFKWSGKYYFDNYYFYMFKKINIKKIYNNNLILLIYSIFSCFFLVIATYNLGVAIRQKCFFYTFVFYPFR